MIVLKRRSFHQLFYWVQWKESAKKIFFLKVMKKTRENEEKI